MNGIPVKTYLLPEHSKASVRSIAEADEIRRFNLAINTSSSGVYSSLISKIQTAYGQLLSDSSDIKTYWQDEENDLVGFSTDSEFQYAYDVQTALRMSKQYEPSPALFKVYIKRSVQPKSDNQQAEHEEEPQIHFGVVCDGCEGSIIGTRYKCSICPDYDLCETCQSKKIHAEHSLNKMRKPRCHFFNGGFAANASASGRHHKHQKRHNCARANNPFQHMFQEAASQLPQFPLISNPDQLKSFGEYLKTLLDPLGVDVSYYVDNLTNKTASNKEEKTQAKPTEKPEPKETEPKETYKEEAEQISLKRTGSLMDESITSDPSVVSMAENILLVNDAVTPKPQHNSTEETKASAPEREELIDLKNSINPDSPFEFAVNALRNATDNNRPETEEERKKNENMVDGFNLIDIEKELKIIKSIESLRSMGYSDDGGWLTRLVSQKNGNINAVLDAITPFGPKN